MTGAAWVVVGENCFRCLRCNARHDLQMPASIPLFVKHAEAFERLHEDCPSPTVPPAPPSVTPSPPPAAASIDAANCLFLQRLDGDAPTAEGFRHPVHRHAGDNHA